MKRWLNFRRGLTVAFVLAVLLPLAAARLDRDGFFAPARERIVAPMDINAANAQQLEKIPGIGPVLSQRVLELRDELGGFERVEQLLEVKGIGEKTLAVIRCFLLPVGA